MARSTTTQREVEVLAALNHSDIARIRGLEQSDSTIALVMEFVEGSTLADRHAASGVTSRDSDESCVGAKG